MFRSIKLTVKLVLVAMMVVTVSCKPSNDAANANPNELSMFANIEITAPEGKIFKQQVAAFKKKHPELKINVSYAYGEPFHQKIAAMAAAGELPDLLYMWPGGRSSNLMENELVQDLYPFLNNDPINDYLYKTVTRPQRNGKLYELPHTMTSTHVLYVNKAVLKKHGLSIPKTYDELKAMVPKLSAKGLETVLMANKDQWVNQSCLFSMILGRIAGDEWIKDAIAGDEKFTDKPFVDALKFTKKIFEDKVINPNSVQVAYGEVPGLFAAGKAPFLIDGEWRVNALVDLFKGSKKNDVELIVFPAIPGEKKPNTTSRTLGVGFGMNAKLSGEKAKNAWKWIKYYADKEAAEYRLKEQGLIPAMKVDTSKFKLVPMVKNRLAFTPKYPGTIVLDAAIDSAPIQVLNAGLQKLAMGAITPEELAKQFEAAVRKK